MSQKSHRIIITYITLQRDSQPMLETVNHSFAVSQGTNLYIATGSTSDIPVLPRWKSSFFATRSGFHSKSTQFQLSKFLQQEELKKMITQMITSQNTSMNWSLLNKENQNARWKQCHQAHSVRAGHLHLQTNPG